MYELREEIRDQPMVLIKSLLTFGALTLDFGTSNFLVEVAQAGLKLVFGYARDWMLLCRR